MVEAEDDPLLRAAIEDDTGGEIVDLEGNVVGRHEGYYNFTIGQRRGLELGGFPERTYVIDIDPRARRVVIGPGSSLERTELLARRIHWISGQPPAGPIEVSARVRSRQSDVAATVTPADGDTAKVTFAAPLRAVAPGQAVVFYQGDLCLGGGWITRA